MDSTHRQTRSQGQAGSQTPAQPLGQPAGQQAQTQTLGQPAGQQAQPSPVSLTAAEIMRILPHRYPFLLVDKIVEAEPGKRAVGIKNVTINEPFFIGHFPAYPVMPGVLIVEAMAQVAGVAGMLLPENKGKLGLFAGIDGIKFKRQVLPGDTLRLEAEFIAMKMGVGKVRVRASVDGATAAEGEIRVALVNQ